MNSSSISRSIGAVVAALCCTTAASAQTAPATDSTQLGRHSSRASTTWDAVSCLGDVAFGAATAVGLARVVQRMRWLSDLPVASDDGATHR